MYVKSALKLVIPGFTLESVKPVVLLYAVILLLISMPVSMQSRTQDTV